MSPATPATVYYSHGGGRYGNQVLRFAHFVAWVEEHRGAVEVVDLPMWPYIRTLAAYDRSPAAIYPVRGSTWNPIARLISALPESLSRSAFTKFRERLTPPHGRRRLGMLCIDAGADDGNGIDLADPKFLAAVRDAGHVWLHGFRIASWPLFEKHADAIRSHLALHERYLPPARRVVEELRRERPFLIGVLCRQTDYRRHHDGRFFLSIEEYRARLEELAELYGGRDKVGFVVTSDEAQPESAFAGLAHRFATGSEGRGGHFLESLAALSMCDVVSGAASTFAGWAAFLGAKPYLPLLPSRPAARDHVLTRALSDAALHPIYGRTIM